jgi:hypothetical protein
VVLGVLILVLVLVGGWLKWSGTALPGEAGAVGGVSVEKQPIAFASHTFDPANPPAEMPPMAPGEEAVCDSNFISNATVGGQGVETDATHEMVTITKVSVRLRLDVNIWVPPDANQHVIEHEDGHRQISEYYYENADKLAQRIAATYIGKKELISGTDLNAEFKKLLEQMGADITEEYDRELNPEPAQLRYDAMTDHGRNEVAAKDAVGQILKDVAMASSTPTAANPGN